MIATARTPRVAAARKLLRPANRAATGRFLAEGPQAVRAALTPVRPGLSGPTYELFATSAGLARHDDLITAATAAGVPVTPITDEAMKALSETVTPQGIVAVCATVDVGLPEILRSTPRLVVVLAGIRDPGNAGTLLRTADAAGADAVVFADDSVDCYNGKCVRASAGSLFHVSVARGVTVTEAASQLRQADLRVLAADGGGEVVLDELAADGRLAEPTAWMFGNEAHGLPAEVVRTADLRVKIPIYGHAESLNVAAAAAICLYACARAQRPCSPDIGRGRNH